MAMATKVEGGSLEWLSIVECTSVLIESIMEDPESVAAALYEKQLLSRDEYRNEVFVIGLQSNPQSKAQRIVAAVENKIKVNSSLFKELIAVLDSQQGILIKHCAEKLLRFYQEKLKNVSRSSNGVTQACASHNKTGFICPHCKQCSLESYFTLGCPQARFSEKHGKSFTLSYPFLDIKHLSRKDEYLLHKKLKKDFTKVTSAFLIFCKHLSESKVLAGAMDKIKASLSFMPIFNAADKEKFSDSASVLQILAVLCIKHASFYNYELIELIINQFGSDDDRIELQKYLDEFRMYCSHNVFEVPASVLHPPQSDCSDPQFALKYLIEGYIDLNQVKSVCISVAEILCINSWDLHLLSIEKGCILLRFVLSKGVAWKVLPFTSHQHEALSRIGISIPNPPSKACMMILFLILIIFFFSVEESIKAEQNRFDIYGSDSDSKCTINL